MEAMTAVSVHALSSGYLTLPENYFVTPSDPTVRRTVPSLSFLVQHKNNETGKLTRILFDLGLKKDVSMYAESIQQHCRTRFPIRTRPDVVESLENGSLSIDDIDYIVLSHVHYDHAGTPKDFTNQKTTFIVGPGSLDLLAGRSNEVLTATHNVFEEDILPLDRTLELPSTTKRVCGNGTSLIGHLSPKSSRRLGLSWTDMVGPFPSGIDFFGDHSVIILDAPGHLPGHLNLLCLVSMEPPKYVLLAGDAFHDMRLFTGEREIASWTDDAGNLCCAHTNKEKARETIARLREVYSHGLPIRPESENKVDEERKDVKAEVEVITAHDGAWNDDAVRNGRFWPGKL